MSSYCWLVLAVFCFSNCHCLTDMPKPLPGTNTYQLRMPGVTPLKDDDYMCTAFKLDPDQELFITGFRVEGTAERAHHMILSGCGDVPTEGVDNASWNCGSHGTCKGSSRILYAWALNAAGTQLPPSVGFRIGSGAKSIVKYLVVQVHYAKKLPTGVQDYSGLDLEITSQPQRYVAGIWLMAGMPDIPPNQAVVNADSCCPVTMPAPIHVFAARVHAHGLGKVITGYKYDPKTKTTELIVKGNPQWPQAFYPTEREFVLGDGDEVLIRCTYESLGIAKHTRMGATGNDEMCNVYFMYYSEDVNGTFYPSCGYGCNQDQIKAYPADSIEPLPANPILEAYALHGNKHNKAAVPQLIVQKIQQNSTANERENDKVLNDPMNLNRVYYKQVFEDVHQRHPQPEAVQPAVQPAAAAATLPESRPSDSRVESVEQAKQRENLENNIWSLLFFYRRFFL